MLPRVAWQDASSETAVSEPALQQPAPVVTDQPKPTGQPQASGAKGAAGCAPPPPAVHSVLPRAPWHVPSSATWVTEPALQQPRPVETDLRFDRSRVRKRGTECVKIIYYEVDERWL